MDMSWSHCLDEQNKPVTVSCSNVCLHHNHQGICRSCVNAVGIGMGSAFPTWTLLIPCLEHWWVAGVPEESAQAQFTISKSMNSKVTLSEVFFLPAPRFPWFIFPEIAFAGSFWVQEKTGYLVLPKSVNSSDNVLLLHLPSGTLSTSIVQSVVKKISLRYSTVLGLAGMREWWWCLAA